MSAQVVPHCFLCQSTRERVLDQLTAREMESLWFHMGVRLDPDAMAPFAHVNRIQLHECKDCGFQYFSPVLPGNSAFYANLQSQIADYYPALCPAFARTLTFADQAKVKEVFDLGCGSGSFLDLAKAQGLKTFGLDLNTQAVAGCQERGHEVVNATAEAYAVDNPDKQFPLVTAFEVMEHVPDPAAFFRDAAKLVAPGGWLAIAVPNNEGVHRLCSLEPHQWPPHHLTRWRSRDLQKLGADNQLIVEHIDGDILRGVQLRFYLKLQRDLEVVLGRRSGPPGKLWPELVTFLYRLGLCRHYVRRGISLHALYRKPAQ
jgi:2-polyprenyl-3-methyl-5-hydroxy-6-metoxy-1,4-benzoquinol methylase